MKPRRKKGATMGLIIVCALVIVAIGVGCFFLAKIAGGGREVTNATDAGTLNVARQALRSQASEAAIPANSDFLQLADPLYPGYMTLYTYNRAVAQALLVAMNAQQENTDTARTDAGLVFKQLQQMGSALATVLEKQANLQPSFNQVAQLNSLKMYGNNIITQTNYKWAFMKPGGSTNIWFDPSVFPKSPAGINLFSALPNVEYTPSKVGDVGAYQNKYMAGYQAITVPGVPDAGPFVGVPVFPQQTPHLVRLADFNGADNSTYTGSTNGLPPNSFECTSQTKDSKSGNVGGALSCAIVGCAMGGTNATTSPVDFPGAIPGGYILISNANAATPPNGWTGVTDMSDSIFNNELNPGSTSPGIESVPITGNAQGIGQDQGQDLFYQPAGSQQTAVNDWEAFDVAQAASPNTPPNQVTWTNSKGQQKTGTPTDSLDGIYVTTTNGAKQAAAVPDMESLAPLSQGINCLTQDLAVKNWLTSPLCTGTKLQSFESAYGRLSDSNPAPGGSSGATMNEWSAVDGLKADIIMQYKAVGVDAGQNDIVLAEGLQGPPAGPGSTISVKQSAGNYASQAAGTITAAAYSGVGVYKIDTPMNGVAFGRWDDVNIADDPGAANDSWFPEGGGQNNGLNTQPLEYVYPNGPTVWQLLTQIGLNDQPCIMNTVIADLVQRCNEIVPGTTQAQVEALLNNPNYGLNMGANLYIYKQRPSDPTCPLSISNTAPSWANSLTKPDGPNVNLMTTAQIQAKGGEGYNGACYTQYSLSGGSNEPGLIDSRAKDPNDGQNGASNQDQDGDGNIHDAPFENQSGMFQATDHADFILSSGYQNMLGNLSFYQQLNGSDGFSRPN